MCCHDKMLGALGKRVLESSVWCHPSCLKTLCYIEKNLLSFSLEDEIVTNSVMYIYKLIFTANIYFS